MWMMAQTYRPLSSSEAIPAMNGKKKWNRVRFVAAIAGGVSASCRPVGGSALQQLGDLICGVFCCCYWLAVVVLSGA